MSEHPRPHQFTLRWLLGIVFAVSLYLGIWRMLGSGQRDVFLIYHIIVAQVLFAAGALYFLNRQFPSPPAPKFPKRRV
jgi:hypothetical protein